MANRHPSKSLQIFLTQIIDYAGLYPPASLPLDEAFRNFVHYQKDTEVWMLSRFVIPAARLIEITRQEFPREGVLSFSALGRGGTDAEDFYNGLKSDIADILVFRELHSSAVIVDMFETTLPASALTESGQALELVNKTTDLLNKNGLTVFFEAPFSAAWQSHASQLIRSLRKVKDKHVGFKLRTGGVAADAFPTTEQVAWAIAAVRDAGVPMKATAGLHHPLRHYNETVSAKMHGFLNVFGAGVLALVNNLSIEQIQAILEDEDPASFTFAEAGFSWKNIHADNEQIVQARRDIVSFGSCSFDEPREDLRKLDLM